MAEKKQRAGAMTTGSRAALAMLAISSLLQGAAAATSTLIATADASLQEQSPSSTGNWGNVEAYGSSSSPKVGIFKFDLSSLLGSTVSQATLKLFADVVGNGGGDFAVWTTSGADSWDEASVTWANGPSRMAKLTTVSITTVDQWYSFDVTAYIAAAIYTSVSTVTLWIEADSLNLQQVKFDSIRSDQPNKPKLEVTTGSQSSPPPAAPSQSSVSTYCSGSYNYVLSNLGNFKYCLQCASSIMRDALSTSGSKRRPRMNGPVVDVCFRCPAPFSYRRL